MTFLSNILEMETVQRKVRVMARALGRSGLSGAYGHCSARLDPENFLVCAPRPMGLINPEEAGTCVPVDGPLPEGVLGEVRLHQHIYKQRPKMGAICRFLSPNILTIGATGRTIKTRIGFGAYFHPEVPVWDDPQLIRSDDLAKGAITMMGQSSALILNVNGAIVTAETPERALTLAWNLEEAARVELAILGCGLSDDAPILDEDAAKARAVWGGGAAERVWDYLTNGDPESQATGS